MKLSARFRKSAAAVSMAAVFVLAVFAAAGCGSRGAETEDMGVQLMEVMRQDLSESITLNGTVEGENRVNYSSSASGEITQINVRVGDRVEAGTVIAVLDPSMIENQIAQLERIISDADSVRAAQDQANRHALDVARQDQASQLASAAAEVNAAQAQADAAQARINELDGQIAQAGQDLAALNEQLAALDGGTASDDEDAAAAAAEARAALQARIDEKQQIINDLTASRYSANEDLAMAQSALRAAQSAYQSTESMTNEAVYSAQSAIDTQNIGGSDMSETENQLAELREQLNDCTVTARAAGIVTAVNVSVGDVNTPNTTMVTVENDGDMIFNASVGENDILRIQEGMTATVTSNAVPDAEISGTVIRVVRVGSSTGGGEYGQSSGGFSVQIRLEPCDLLTGMSAKARIVLSDRSGILCVPYDLVWYDGDQTYVLIAEPNDEGSFTAVRRDVTIGEELDYYIEVTGGDLEEGDLIIMDYSIAEGDTFESGGYGFYAGDDSFDEPDGEYIYAADAEG